LSTKKKVSFEQLEMYRYPGPIVSSWPRSFAQYSPRPWSMLRAFAFQKMAAKVLSTREQMAVVSLLRLSRQADAI
jgi:hypothetical protein